jgi:hypothetical protein
MPACSLVYGSSQIGAAGRNHTKILWYGNYAWGQYGQQHGPSTIGLNTELVFGQANNTATTAESKKTHHGCWLTISGSPRFVGRKAHINNCMYILQGRPMVTLPAAARPVPERTIVNTNLHHTGIGSPRNRSAE